ncbi:hypothetical protein HC031_19850 [Planosporangium thailandense]|uniref:Small secreted protein n=1 Tax=Planosporangium thailandense TaxID=765197 RepID=A0ABX0Y0V0_9ACTN|nr:hypothetical protein [Planosporangium thailandense]NJC71953.1 hypothetical protein [Planosporangium thailandense]
MRRLITGVACVGVLLLAACGNSSQSGSSSHDAATTTPTATAAASPTTDLAANTSQVCDAVKQLNTDYPAKFTTLFNQILQLAAQGADEASGQKYVDQMNALTKEWANSLQSEAARASNPELQKTVNSLAAEVTKLESGDASMNDMNNTVQSGNANLAKVCS